MNDLLSIYRRNFMSGAIESDYRKAYERLKQLGKKYNCYDRLFERFFFKLVKMYEAIRNKELTEEKRMSEEQINEFILEELNKYIKSNQVLLAKQNQLKKGKAIEIGI